MRLVHITSQFDLLARNSESLEVRQTRSFLTFIFQNGAANFGRLNPEKKGR